MTPILIGLTGPARSGKDTFAAYLCRHHSFVKRSFAAPIRQFMCDFLEISPTELEAVKDKHIDWLDGITPRRMMQTLGTEWGREVIHPELWIRRCMNLVERRISGGTNVVITDARFENEAEAIRKAGGIIVHISRYAAAKVEAHASEAGILPVPGDFIINNEGSIEELWEKAHGLVSFLSEDLRDAG